MILTTIMYWVKSVSQSFRSQLGQLRAAYRRIEKAGAARRNSRLELDL